MEIKVPLRLDIAGSYTDLPVYRERGGAHINVPLDYYVHIFECACPDKPPCGEEGKGAHPETGDSGFAEDMNYRVAKILKHSSKSVRCVNDAFLKLASVCDLEHGSGLGASSATVVGVVKWYSEFNGLNLKPEEIVGVACKAIEQTGICGRQDEYSAAFEQPLYLRYRDNLTMVDRIDLPEQFQQNIEAWNLMYIPRTMSCQEMLEYEISQNFDTEPIVYFTKLMYQAIQKSDWDEFYKLYIVHWKFVEEQNPYKINDEIRKLRGKYPGIYIRPCGAGAGGYLLIHGNISSLSAAIEGENLIKVKIGLGVKETLRFFEDWGGINENAGSNRNYEST